MRASGKRNATVKVVIGIGALCLIQIVVFFSLNWSGRSSSHIDAATIAGTVRLNKPAGRLSQDEKIKDPQPFSNNITLNYSGKRKEKGGRKKNTLDEAGRNLFSTAINAPSDSDCALPFYNAPKDLCPSEKIEWRCEFSPKFTSFDKDRREIKIECPGPIKVNRVSREEYETSDTKGRRWKAPVWNHLKGPAKVSMATSYLDVACKTTGHQYVHNYHTRFVENRTISRQQKSILDRLKKDGNKSWEPLSILVIVVDSLSRAQAHRACGLPATMRLLKSLYHEEKNFNGAATKLAHRAFLFNRFNSVSGSTVENLTPMFSGEIYENLDEISIKENRYAKKVEEWIWEYASRHGYLTAYSIDNTSGMMGTKTPCKGCHYRSPPLPHVEHGWIKRENEKVEEGVYSGLCDGSNMLHSHVLNYTREFLQQPHSAKWAAIDLNANHRKEAFSVNQIDEDLTEFLQAVLMEGDNLVVFLLGDHGKDFVKDSSNLGGYYETLLPFLSVIVPNRVLNKMPLIEDTLKINQERFIVHSDLHNTMKSFMHFPNLEKIEGNISDKSTNILTQVIPK